MNSAENNNPNPPQIITAQRYLSELLSQLIYCGRKKLQINREELASRLGISLAFMNRLEKGSLDIPPKILAGCIHILELDFESISEAYKKAGEKTARDIWTLAHKL